MRHDKDSAGIVAAHIMRVCLYACTEGGGGGGGSGGCGSAKSAAPAMTEKLEQKAIEELEDMSIIEEVCPDFWCLVYAPKCVSACARADIGMCT